MRFCTLASGSKANVTLVEIGGTRILVDCGLGTRTLAKRLADAGVSPSSIDAVVLTHEHDDHVKGLAPAVIKWGWMVIATPGTLAGTRDVPSTLHSPLPYGTARTIGDAVVELVAVPHDASEPAAVVITSAETGERLGVATDLGHVPDAMSAAFERLDYLVLESNHCETMLRNGPYPPFLQARIASDRGHLSNRQTGLLLERIAHRGLRQVLLAHLSQKNNLPKVALDAATATLKRTAFKGAVECAAQDVVTRPGGSRVGQIELAL